MIEHLSSSQIDQYIRCSLKYRFRYIDLIPPPFKSSSLFFGSAIHSSLDWLHKKRIKGEEVSLSALYRIFDAEWYAQKLDTEIHYKDWELDEGLRIMGKEMLSLYLESIGDNGNGFKGAEVSFTVPIKNPANGDCLAIPLEGIFDLIEEDDTVVEFKTSSKALSPQDPIYYVQLTAYSYAYMMLYQRMPKHLKIIDFVKTKTPKIVPVETERDEEDHQRLFHMAKEVLKGIKSGVFFPQPSFWCNDCEYEEHCKRWRGN